MINLTFWNTHDIGGVMFDTSVTHFKQVLSLDMQLDKPRYQVAEKGFKRDGEFVATDSVSFKIHTGNVFVPEYILDALNVAKVCDNVFIDGVRVNSIVFKIRREIAGMKEINLEIITDLVMKSELDEISIEGGFLRIDDSHHLLIGDNYKLRVI